MVGRNVKLYDMVLQFLRTLFLRTRNVHYCTLRAELLMSLHDLDVGDICSVDPCHKVDAPWPPSSPGPLWSRPLGLCAHPPPAPAGGPSVGAPSPKPTALLHHPPPLPAAGSVCPQQPGQPHCSALPGVCLPLLFPGSVSPCSRAFVVSSVFWNRAFRTALS